MLVEMFIFLMHNPPKVNYNFTLEIRSGIRSPYSLNMVLSILAMMKIYVIPRAFFRYSTWINPQEIHEVWYVRGQSRAPGKTSSSRADCDSRSRQS